MVKDILLRLKEKVVEHFSKAKSPEKEEYLELGHEVEESRAKIVVRPFVIETFESVKPIIDALREGYTIALINIRPLKEKDLVELKRAISKIKKTTFAVDGDIAGFGEDYLVAAPSFVTIYRSKQGAQEEE